MIVDETRGEGWSASPLASDKEHERREYLLGPAGALLSACVSSYRRGLRGVCGEHVCKKIWENDEQATWTAL